MGKVVEAAIDAEAEIARLRARVNELEASRRNGPYKSARLVGGPKDGLVVSLEGRNPEYHPLRVPYMEGRTYPLSYTEAVAEPFAYGCRTGRYDFVCWMKLDPSVAIFEWMGDR